LRGKSQPQLASSEYERTNQRRSCDVFPYPVIYYFRQRISTSVSDMYVFITINDVYNQFDIHVSGAGIVTLPLIVPRFWTVAL
jgi:hypothetical protein